MRRFEPVALARRTRLGAAVAWDEGGGAGLAVLEQGDGPGEVPHDLIVGALVHLVGHVLDEGVHCLDLGQRRSPRSLRQRPS